VEKNARYLFIFGVLVLYMLALYVWLNYGVHATYWLPYDNVLFYLDES